MKSILISCGARLAPFDIAELREIMSDDELELDTLGDRKTALFLIMSDTDTTFNFVIAMLQSQLFNLLCNKADDVYGGRLPVHMRCLLDEFANIGQIPNFDKLIATIRSREISASIILQSQSQLKTIYKDAADTIVGNCDTTLFLGGKEKSTLKEICKTAKSILISCGARLAPFDIKELRDLMSYDELELDTLGDRKTALFLIMSDTDSTFNFVIAMLQSQLFNLLCDKADDEYGGKLPVHVRCLLDEFANIGQIPQFEKLIATIRSREISASIILQSQSQLKAIYKDAAEIILDNADSTLFLGGRGKNAKDISENLGRETIDSFNTSENRGTQVSHGLNYQKLGKELMTQDEIAVMDGGKCILQLRGVRPFFSDKYDITQHPNYKYLSDFDKKNAFDVERYMSTRPAIVKPDEPFDIYEIDLSDEDAAAE